jgi:hypothetical protein
VGGCSRLNGNRPLPVHKRPVKFASQK